MTWIRQAITIALNFIREKTPESSTRLIAVMLCATGCICALANTFFAFKHPDQGVTITALVGDVAALIASGCVAIVNRTPTP